MSIQIVAVTTFEHHGTAVSIGDTLDVRPVEAAVLVRARKAVFPHQYVAPSMTAKPRRRRTYRRRDMVADPS